MSHERKFYVPPSGPPQERPSPEIYQVMGEGNIFKMLEDFYLELEKSSIRHMFPQDMKEASKKTALFFVFLLGGPPLYHEKHGPPMMRKRHMPFVIDEEARQVWLNCFKLTLKASDVKYHFPPQHVDAFITFLERFSEWMVNTKGNGDK